jgi:hypothetical protein
VLGLERVDVTRTEPEMAADTRQPDGRQETQAVPTAHGPRRDMEPVGDVLCREKRCVSHGVLCSVCYTT